jgi:tRNA (guanine-N7-)-methyltransferase
VPPSKPYEDDGKPKFYGRRKGKSLKTGRQASYDEIMSWARVTLPEGDAPVDPRSFFDFPVTAVWLEIGFGNGEQLVHQALNIPTIGMIGCEPFMNGVSALCRDIKAHGIKNIRIWQDDARLLMPRLKDKTFSRCFVLNSDPWPKTRHHKRRFIQTETLDELHRLLAKGSELRLSSDDPGLNMWQLEKPYFHGGYEWLAKSAADWRNRPEDMLGTRYQNKGAKQGRATMFLNFKTI